MNIYAGRWLMLISAVVWLIHGQAFAKSFLISEVAEFEPRKAALQLVEGISPVFQESDEADPQAVERKAKTVLEELLRNMNPGLKSASDKALAIFNVEFPTLLAHVFLRRIEELERKIEKESDSAMRSRQQSLLQYFRNQHQAAATLGKNLRLKYESQRRL
jgi:hypothetical protein